MWIGTVEKWGRMCGKAVDLHTSIMVREAVIAVLWKAFDRLYYDSFAGFAHVFHSEKADG